MRIKYVIPWPFGDERLGELSSAFPRHVLEADTDVDFTAVADSAAFVDCYYDDLIFEMYIVEAGLRAEEEGYDALVMDTISDSGMSALRSRLTIPVVGPGIACFALAQVIGTRFSVITMWDRWLHHYKKALVGYGLQDKCASTRAIDATPNLGAPDAHSLFGAKDDELLEKLTAAARAAVEEDGADVIVLGSTTMHQAHEHLHRELGVPVINPGPVGIKMAEALVRLSLAHSKVAFPSPLKLQDEKFALLSANKRTRDQPPDR